MCKKNKSELCWWFINYYIYIPKLVQHKRKKTVILGILSKNVLINVTIFIS